MAVLLALLGCSDDGAPQSARMDFVGSLGAEGDLYAAPWPSDHRLNADGTVALAAFPNPDRQPIVTKIMQVLDGRAQGFAVTGASFFALDTTVAASLLPDAAASVADDASVYLVAVDSNSPDFLVRHPIDVVFLANGGPYGASNMLVALPLQGMPLQPATRYATVITTALGLEQSPVVVDLAAGRAPAGLAGAGLESYQLAARALADAGLLDSVVALSAFTTSDSAAELIALSEHAHSLAVPAPVAPLVPEEVFADFCVFSGEIGMPVYQTGEPPYSEEGGEILFGASGPAVDHVEQARIVVTIPRVPMPEDGWPTVVMIRTGGGGDRPLADRGVRGEPGGEALVAGTGPAREFARAGYAGVSVDGPHGGIRNITGGDEQFLVFNFANAFAMRDNVRQSAIELALLPEILDNLSVDSAGCPDATSMATFDTSHLALFGHSMGASIAPLTLAANPRYGAVILSGAGASWIENVVFKQSPLEVRPLADILVGYTGTPFTLHEHDPVLTMLQWAAEPADVPLYGDALGSVHVLMFQGIVDTYILPPIANATSLALGLDLAGPERDRGHPDLAAFRPLTDVLPFSGRGQLSFPVAENRGESTGVVVQHEQDGIEDGHEVAFQTEAPKQQYRCFLQSWLSGTPRVVEPGTSCK